MNPRDAITDRLERLEEAVLLLGGVRGQSLTDPYNKAAVERWLQLASGRCIDVARELVTALNLGHADTPQATVHRLHEAGILEDGLATRISDAADLHDILVHDYRGVDAGRLLPFISNLDDFRRFAAAVTRAIEP